MAHGLSNRVVPQDLDDTSSIPSLERLDSETFATLVTEVVSRLSTRTPEGAPESDPVAPFYADFCSLVRRRANEPAIVSAVSGMVSRPVRSEDDLHLILGALFHVVCKLPEDQILPYRHALVALSDTESGVIDNRAYEAFLVPQARALLRFVDMPDEVWVPERKGDLMGLRSLQERVQTARDMRPFVHDLLGWLRDTNWPNYSACEEQLARFPEIAVRPIQKILKDHRGDGSWINNLLQFVQLRVPVGRSWEVMYPQVKALIDAPQGDEDECETADRAKEWLTVLNRWRSSQEGLSDSTTAKLRANINNKYLDGFIPITTPFATRRADSSVVVVDGSTAITTCISALTSTRGVVPDASAIATGRTSPFIRPIPVAAPFATRRTNSSVVVVDPSTIITTGINTFASTSGIVSNASGIAYGIKPPMVIAVVIYHSPAATTSSTNFRTLPVPNTAAYTSGTNPATGATVAAVRLTTTAAAKHTRDSGTATVAVAAVRLPATAATKHTRDSGTTTVAVAAVRLPTTAATKHTRDAGTVTVATLALSFSAAVAARKIPLTVAAAGLPVATVVAGPTDKLRSGAAPGGRALRPPPARHQPGGVLGGVVGVAADDLLADAAPLLLGAVDPGHEEAPARLLEDVDEVLGAVDALHAAAAGVDQLLLGGGKGWIE